MDRNEINFGRFCLNLSQRRLARDGVKIPLGGRALDILCVLGSANGKVVSKDELMARVWPGLVVEENNIQVHISALRKALDEGKSGDTHLITVPGRGYRLLGVKPPSVSDTAADDAYALAPLDKPSIAVLPFQNISGDPEQEYFVDGMVEEIITGLSRVKWLSVISRNSTAIYKHRPVLTKGAAEIFGVRYVLEGSVRKLGNHIRIAAQLIDANSDLQLWAEQYNRVSEDVFALQDEIAMCVIGAIEPSVRKAEIDRVKRQRPTNLSAYDLLLRSLPFALSHVPKESAPAIPLLENALALQPDYAAAHAFLSRCLHHRFARGGLHEEDRIAAIQHAHAAIAHGSDDATALAVAAYIIAYDEHDVTTALKLFDRALELSTSNVFALSFSAIILAWMGKIEPAIERARLALRLSPFDIYNFRANFALALAHFNRGRYGDAVEAARSTIHANPSFSIGYATLAAALFRIDHVVEARAAAQAVLAHDPTFTIGGAARIFNFELAVFKPLADAWREIGLPE